MHLDQNPVFRKVIVPWYDGDIACSLTMALMTLVILWGGTGLSVCCEMPQYQKYAWVPFSLVLLGSSVLLSVSIRLIKRHLR